MISRRAAQHLAELYEETFWRIEQSPQRYGSDRRVPNDKALYDFLYSNGHPAWLCDAAAKLGQYSTTRLLKEFVMKLHTGQTQAEATPNWSWEQREKLGQQYLHALGEDILNHWETLKDQTRRKYVEVEISTLRRSLELDGYVYRDSRLLIPEAQVLDVEEVAGVLEALFTSLGLPNRELAFHDLDVAEKHYINGDWDDAISNSRQFLECVLQEVAAAHSSRCRGTELPVATYERPVRVRQYLQQEGLLEPKEVGALAEVYGLLSHTGSHPYMAKSDQARLLRQMALILAEFVMLRFQGCLQAMSATAVSGMGTA